MISYHYCFDVYWNGCKYATQQSMQFSKMLANKKYAKLFHTTIFPKEMVNYMSNFSPLHMNRTKIVPSCDWFGSPPINKREKCCEYIPHIFILSVFAPQVADAGNVTSSTLRFQPKINDQDKLLRCRAENPVMPASQIEDTWTLDVNCKPHFSMQKPVLSPCLLPKLNFI